MLREVYGHLYRRILDRCLPGITVEVGGGSGNFKDFCQDAVSFDIVHAPWLDLVADAQALPFATGSLSNIVMLDVLHHIEVPVRFLREAHRTLRDGGRIVVVEPGISIASWPFYHFLHEEPVDMSVNPLAEADPSPGRNPYEGNQGIPTLLATRYQTILRRALPGLPLVRSDWLGLVAYPLSGGFKPWSLLTPGVARALLAVEDRMPPWFARLLGFRLMLVFEKRSDTGPKST